ncbi:MAG: hypothetical protein CK425_11875 [Parachlamydia sp.]|nr:MAG: hypothetical protein CK425_11875 [Parachlamydia sp.]
MDYLSKTCQYKINTIYAKETLMLITKKQPSEKPKTPKAASSTPAKPKSIQTPQSNTGSDNKKPAKTRIIIQYDVGFNNHIYLRGAGANLSWDKGLKLKNIKADEWLWETDQPFNQCEFKALINDQIYETGENHQITSGNSASYAPKFP